MSPVRWRRVIVAVMAAGMIMSSLHVVAGPLRVGNAAPAFRLADLDGARTEIPADCKGKITVLHFWASWCPSCVAEMKALQSLTADMGDKGFVPLSINVGEDRQHIDAYTRPLGITYTILQDSDSSVARAYGVTGIPMTFILDRSGTIRYKIMGEINREGIRRLLKTIL